LAVASAPSPSRDSRIESGARNPSIEALIAIAAKLETTALALMTGDHRALCPVCGRGHIDE
jgi:transcriptional regulator with XRE-family HTH domain